MGAILLALLQTLVPILLKSAEDGTLETIVGDVIAIGKAAAADPDSAAAISGVVSDAFDAVKAAAAIMPRPAQPEDPAMERAAGHSGMGGR